MPLNATPAAHPPLRRFVRRIVDSLAAWPVRSADDARAMLATFCRDQAELNAATEVFRQRAPATEKCRSHQ